MKLSKALQKFTEQARKDDSYWVEKAKLDYSVALEKQRKRSGMTFAALAKKIGTSAAYITKVFRGDSNLTIESMVKLARATGGRLTIQVADDKADASRWTGTLSEIKGKAANQTYLRTGTVVFMSDHVKREEKQAA